MEKTKILEMNNISKEFNAVRVLSDVDFDLEKGEVHAIIGANGAGKSTLVKILNGILIKYDGEIILNGEKITLQNPKDAFEHGIAMIHQELDLVNNLDVSENIFLGREKFKDGKLKLIDRHEMRAETQKLLSSLNFDIKANALVGNLPPAKQQLVLIARTVAQNARVIIMDEPTSSLSINEIEALFSIIKDLKSRGISIIYISHFLEEIFNVADRVTVLRDGKKVVTENVKGLTHGQLVEWMIGRYAHGDRKAAERERSDEVILSVKGLTQKRGIVKDATFELKRGEVLGIAGVVGSGRTELAKMIFGAEEIESGEIRINGKQVLIDSPYKAVSEGIALVPEDRKTEGIVLKRKINDNISLATLKENSTKGFLSYEKISKLVKQMIQYMSIKCLSANQEVAFLSGGNQQKVAIGKWLAKESEIVILDQPTRGVDVGAKEEIYKLIDSLAEKGTSIIIISDELEELLNLADRLLVMKKGRIITELFNRDRSLNKPDVLTPMVS